MSRTVKHPPKTDRFTRRDRTGRHAKARKLRREYLFDAVATAARPCGGREVERGNVVGVYLGDRLKP